jgi:hypothetical protein
MRPGRIFNDGFALLDARSSLGASGTARGWERPDGGDTICGENQLLRPEDQRL